MHRRRFLVLGLIAALLAIVAPAAQAGGGGGRFIVVLKDSVERPGAVAAEHGRRFGADVQFVYRHALKGYAAHIDGRQLGALRADRRVAYIEPDGIATIDTTQAGATWGIDRIDQRNLPLSTTYSYTNTGAGVTAYVIDTGIRISHTDFGGRARYGYDAIDGLPADDCHGHGTHVAGTIGGTAYGVAKGVSLVAVRVLDCAGSGTWGGVIAGIDFVTGHHTTAPAVANMSLGGGAMQSVDDAVARSVTDGVVYAVAAGNSNADACRYSPARAETAITVGATTKTDYRASYSNYGRCLDIFAPGSSITSAWKTSDAATNTISGTSMATPHVAGVAALYLQTNTSATPLQVRDALRANASGPVLGLGKRLYSGTTTLLLFTSY